jgi:hypothetical protein
MVESRAEQGPWKVTVSEAGFITLSGEDYDVCAWSKLTMETRF